MSSEQKARILIVDDQREIARVLRTALELANQGYSVTDVPSGEEAILELHRVDFDILITDYRLPGLSGAELAERVRKQNPDIKISIITGHSPETVKEELGDTEVQRIFSKPIDTEAFVVAITQMLQSPQPLKPEAKEPEEKASTDEFDTMAAKQQIHKLLVELGALGITLVNHMGKIVIKTKDIDDFPRYREISVLLANNFATATDIVPYLGDGLSKTIHYYGGKWYDIYALSITPQYFMAILFPGGNQKQMGPVLRYGAPTARKLAKIITEEPQIAESEATPILQIAPADAPAVEEEAGPTEEPQPEPEPDEILNLVKEGEVVEQLDLDMEDLALDLEGMGDLDSFWDEAAAIDTEMDEGILSHDEAMKMGLIPDENDKDA